MKEVTIIQSPVTTRYVAPGAQARIDEKTNRISVGGVWFDFDPIRWKVVTEEGKKDSFIQAASKTRLTDHEFNVLIEAYAITEEIAMEWMIETGNFIRNHLDREWYFKNNASR